MYNGELHQDTNLIGDIVKGVDEITQWHVLATGALNAKFRAKVASENVRVTVSFGESTVATFNFRMICAQVNVIVSRALEEEDFILLGLLFEVIAEELEQTRQLEEL